MSQANFVHPRELKRLSQLSPWRTATALVLDWTVIAAAIALCAWSGSWFVIAAAIPVIAGRMHGLAGLMHDFAHYRFVQNKRLSDAIGDLFLAWPLLATVEGYRRNHLAHHRYTNTDADPDWVIKLGTREFTFPQEMRFAILNFLGYFVGVSSIRDMRSALKRIKADDPHSRVYKLVRLNFYMLAAAAIAYFGLWKGFLLYWALPYFTLFFFFLYIRSVAEHFGETMDHSSELGGTRTVIPHFWERWFFCPHNLNNHLEHHIYPSVPFYNLPELRHVMDCNASYASGAHITRGYVTGLLREVWLDGWRKRRIQRRNNAIVPAE
jgi:fatty acid desaturase